MGGGLQMPKQRAAAGWGRGLAEPDMDGALVGDEDAAGRTQRAISQQ